MAQRERLRALLNERMTSTGDGIYQLFEEKIREYEEEIHFLNEEYNLRQKLLDNATKQGMPVMLVNEDEGGPSEEQSAAIKEELAEDKKQKNKKSKS